MTPKEKADNLINKYWDSIISECDDSWDNAKQCALIAVDEILEELSHEIYYDSNYGYWKQVKQEIEAI